MMTNPAMDTLLARVAIRDLLERYCRAVDRLDAELLRSVYWPDAIDDHGIFKGRADEFIDFALPLLGQMFESTMHQLGQSLIEVDGARANSETYFVAYHRAQKDGDSTLDVVGGRYIDVLTAREGEWRITHRVVVLEWSHSVAGHGQPRFALSDFEPARRSREDLAYGGR